MKPLSKLAHQKQLKQLQSKINRTTADNKALLKKQRALLRPNPATALLVALFQFLF